MKRLPVLLACTLSLAFAAAGTAQPSAPGKTIGVDGTTVTISADGARVAIHATGNCGAGWTPATGSIVRLQGGSCKDADRALDSFTLAGDRFAWVDYLYGNHAYCDGPFTATFAAPKTKNVGFCAGDSPDFYWEFAGDGGLLVGEYYESCEIVCVDANGNDLPEGTSRASVELYRFDGKLKRIASLENGADMQGVSAGRILVREPGGRLVLYSSTGKRGLAIAAGADRGLISTNVVVGVKGVTVKVYDVETGAPRATRTLPPKVRLWDVDGTTAVYSGGGAIRLLDLASGKSRLVANATKVVGVDLEPPGLFYAHNSGKGSKPGRVTFIPSGQLR